MDDLKKKSSLRIEGGVRKVLEDLQQEMVSQLKDYLIERRAQGWNELSDSEIETIARKAGVITRTSAGTAIGQAFQMGVDKSVAAEAYERPTARGDKKSPVSNE